MWHDGSLEVGSDIGGRMANMADLISKGLLKAGDKLVWKKKQLGITHIAEILANGNIKTQDGT